MSRHVWPCLLLLLSPLTSVAAPVEFNRDIRPILSEYCLSCHGPDTAKRKAGLRLDTPEGAKDILVAGKPDESELYLRLTSAPANKQMPPRATGKKLEPQQVALLKRWIEEGAKYQPHWSFIAPTRPKLPEVKDTKWGRGAIDRFVLAGLDAEGLKPSGEAERRVLIRRLSFDLTGLPPTADEVKAFVEDRSERAYENLVERLLKSKHHGERLAQYWLDLVRYADTGGYHSDNHRDIALYRDYVIEAFNANKRFDVFTAEQLAGDLLPGAGTEQKIASGYNRLLMTTEEGGAQPKEYAAKYAADRVRNASVVWLGLTMGCAECHTHKYDPVTIKEFYGFAAFWADIREKAVGRQDQTKVMPPALELEMAQVRQEIEEVKKGLDGPVDAAALKKWEEKALAELAGAKPAWVPVKPTTASAKAKLTATESGFRAEPGPAKDSYTLTLPVENKATGLRLTAVPLADGRLSHGNGNFVLTRVTVTAQVGKGKATAVAIKRAVADFSQAGYPVDSLVGKKAGPGWAVEGHVRKGQRRIVVFTFDRVVPAGAVLTVKLDFTSPFPQHAIAVGELALTEVDAPGLGDKAGLPPAVAAALQVPGEKRTEAQKTTLANFYRSIDPSREPGRQKLAQLQGRLANLEKSAPQTLISQAGPPRVMRVLPRGNWLDDSGEVVEPMVPGSLPALNVKGRANRLDLAKWLVREDNPLVARVFVNRLWKLFYGQGLVTTLDDFGSQGTYPSHPELLDWLALEFRESGWDVRHMVRLMVSASAYRQTSVADAALRAKDPYNRLLARQSRYRLDAEFVRDNALAVSGLLVDKVGGPSAKPYQPAGYWAYLNFPKREWQNDTGEGVYRRGLYTYWQRTFPHPSLLAFDAPSREECSVERPRSNTPQQALVLLNDPTYVEAARKLAERVVKAEKDDAGRLEWAYRRVLGRAPREGEVKVLLPLLARHREQFKADAAGASGLLSVGAAPVDGTLDKAELAAWTSVARVLLNLHETITRE